MTLLLEHKPSKRVGMTTREVILNCFHVERSREAEAGRSPLSHMTATEIAAKTGLNRSTVIGHLERLQGKKLVAMDWYREHGTPRTRLWRLAEDPA